MGLGVFDFDENDPTSLAREAAEGITKAREEAGRRGITSFLFRSASVEEFDQRAEFGGVAESLDEVSDLYLGSPDQRVKLTATLRREFEAQQDESKGKAKEQAKDLTHPGTIRGHEALGEASNEGTIAEQIVNKPSDTPKERAKNELNRNAARDAFAVCPTCEGRGSHVNPSIDSQGLSAEDFDEDPDFREDYFSGAYDVPCAECRGNRVVPQCADDSCSDPALAKEHSGLRDRRDRVSIEHYPNCAQHLTPDDAEEHEDLGNMYAEQEAERRMGA